MKYLIYIKYNGKVSPQLWAEDFSKSLEKRIGFIVERIALTEEDKKLTFNELIGKYPYEENSLSITID